MLSVMARTRPMRSPSQPNSTPPVAAPTRKPAVTTPNQTPIRPSSVVCSRSLDGPAADHREDAHLGAVEQPAQQRRGQRQVLITPDATVDAAAATWAGRFVQSVLRNGCRHRPPV